MDPEGMSEGSTRKHYFHGTHRLVGPAQTVARARPHMPTMGITRIADVTGLDVVGIPVVMVCRPNARSLSVSQGKGLDLDAARASGLMEAIELWHAEHIHHPLIRACKATLGAGNRLIDTDGLPRTSIGAFGSHRKILWIEGRSLMDGDPLLVPYEVVHMDFTLPLPDGSGCFLTTSSGLASGNHELEAVLHGLYELCERDAVALWLAAGSRHRRNTRVDPTTIDDPHCLELLERFARADIAVGIWDATSDIGLPVFVVEIVDRHPHDLRVLYVCGGQGCHRARSVALVRALTEAAQSRLTAISGARDDADRGAYQRFRRPAQIDASLAEIDGAPPTASFGDVPDRWSTSLEDDLEAVLAALRDAGLRQAAVVDLTRPEIGIPVARVVVPGLESMTDAPGYTPGLRARARMPQR